MHIYGQILIVHILGIIEKELGNYVKAKVLYTESYQLYNNYLGKEHLKTAWVVAHLGIIEKELGNFLVSENIIYESLKIYNK